MMDREIQKLMQKEAKHFGISNGLRNYSPYPFAGINQQSSARQGMRDQEFWWLENFIKTGDGCLRTLYDQGSAIYTAPVGKTIVYFYHFNIGSNNYAAIVLNDGTAIQVNTATGVQTTISSTPNTFYNTGISTQLPICGQWGSTYLLIANNNTSNNYWVWDGTNLHTSGTLAPGITLTSGGSNYSSAPTVTAYGGSGSGATFTATVTNGTVVGVELNSPGSGYTPGEIIQLEFTGGGSDNSAVLIASLATGTVGFINLLDGGSGYTSPVAVTISGGSGSGATATVVQSGGVITSVTITSPGSGYTSTPSISFSGGPGAGASAVASLNPGSVSTVTVSHGGSGYASTPTLTITGGGGTGATAVATVTGGAITSVNVTNGGSGYTSVPAVVVQTGINHAASATATLMPFGVSGTSIETFLQRVWIGYPHQSVTGNGTQQTGAVYNVSAPGSFTNFATSSGGLQFTSSDSFLRSQYVNFKQSNGYLYPIGDSSVNVVSNVQTSGVASVTTFNYQNTEPQIGTSWRDSLQAFSRTLVLANVFGVFELRGGAVVKISKNMDNIFNNIKRVTGGVTPTSAVANIFNIKAYLLNITILDPFTGSQRTVMLGWDEKDWFVASASSTCTFIGTQAINSNMIAWGTDGSSLFPLFNSPSTSITKKMSTKMYGADNFMIQKESMGVYMQVQDLSSSASGASITSLTIDSEHGSYSVPQIPTFPSAIPPYYPIVSIGSGDIAGCNLGATLTTTSADMTVNYFGLSHIEVGSIAMASSEIQGTINTE